MSIIDNLISKLAPHECVGCGQEGALLCRICGAKLIPSAQRSASGLLRVGAATAYDSVAKDLIWQLKFQGAQAAASVMARYMAPLIDNSSNNLIVVPAPTATQRVRRRGFDQAKLLAQHLAKQQRLTYADCLRRYGQTHQVGASREERLLQLQAAFCLKHEYHIQNCQIILVDDVITTGATLEAASSVLLAAGAHRVDAVVFASA